MYRIIKRSFDVLFALLALVVLLPIFLPLMIALRLTGEGEIFYGQNRIGLRNSIFKIWKFATMLKNSPNMLTGSLTLRNDPRVTPVGRFLRKSKLNELPQFYNVLTGDMSFVGPRPQMRVDFEAFPKHVQEKIYDVQPGITGIGSVIFRDEESYLSRPDIDPIAFYKDVIAPYKGEVELWYQQNISFVTDFKLLFLTAWQIIFPDSTLTYRVFPGLPPLPAKLQVNK